MKRSKCLLISALFGSAYLAYIISYIYDGISTENTFEALGAGIATAMLTPHLICVAIAVIFNWIGFAGNIRWAALTGGIMYTVGGLLWVVYAPFVVPSLIFSFVGFANLKNLPSGSKNLAYARKCVYCGTPRERGEVFNRYGFCEDCRDEVSSNVRQQLSGLQNACSSLNPDRLSPDNYITALSAIDQQLNIICQLEELRPRVPMFKSSTLDYETTLLRHRAALCEKLGIENTPPVLPNRAIKEGASNGSAGSVPQADLEQSKRIMETAQLQAKQLLENAKLEAEKTKASLEEQGKEIMETAQSQAKQLLENAKLEAEKAKNTLEETKTEIEKLESNAANIKKELQFCEGRKEELEEELRILETDTIIGMVQIPDYEGLKSDEIKNQLALLKMDQDLLIKDEKAVSVLTLILNNSQKKVINTQIKQILRCFNAECLEILNNATVKNVDHSRSKIQRSFETLNKIFEIDHVQISQEYLASKFQELSLVYAYLVKEEEEREQRRAIREQMQEEEKVRREIEYEKQKIAKEESQFSNEINKLMSYLQQSKDDLERKIYVDKISALEEKLKQLETEKDNVFHREQNTRAGFVYIISNIGSFGENVFKIGMTRRLEPMDRIAELSSASVPFPFDVHALIFSEDAPALESILHKHFESQRVNKINPRKEFFHVDLEEIKETVLNNHNATVKFIDLADATEYRETLRIEDAAVVQV